MSAPPTPAPPKTDAQLAAEREERIEIQVRAQGKVFEARHFMLAAERERDEAKRALTEERAAHVEQYRRLQSTIEALEQKVLSITALGRHFNLVDRAVDRKAAVLRDVADGKLCRNAAAPPAEIQKEAAAKIEKGEEQCQNQK